MTTEAWIKIAPRAGPPLVKPNSSHLSRSIVFETYLCNPCTILCPEKCTRKLVFFCISQCQAGREGGCVWAQV